jgi:hypothetical protein
VFSRIQKKVFASFCFTQLYPIQKGFEALYISFRVIGSEPVRVELFQQCPQPKCMVFDTKESIMVVNSRGNSELGKKKVHSLDYFAEL